MTDEDTGVAGAVGSDAPNTLLDQLAAKRKEISETRETMVPIPGFDKDPPLLLAKYRLLEGPELDRIGTQVRRQVKGRWERQITAAIDTFVAACEGIYVDKGDGSGPQPLTLDGVPITGYTEELARALQFADQLPNPPTARSIVLGLFTNNDVAISTHAMVLSRWFADTSVDVSQELLEGNL
jgi:hypothetical protein